MLLIRMVQAVLSLPPPDSAMPMPIGLPCTSPPAADCDVLLISLFGLSFKLIGSSYLI